MDWQTIIFGSIVILVQYYADEYKRQDLEKTFPVKSQNYFLPEVETYDFIIVGAGIAGCVLASRLTENPNVNVLLLETGGTPPPPTDIPAFATYAIAADGITYHYHSVPQKHANDRVIQVDVGKNMGGTSVLNLMFYNRGHPKDFDNWANVTGDESWKYQNVLKYFKKAENYKGEFPLTDQHAVNGPVTVSKQTFAPGLKEWLNAGREKGYKTIDPNGPETIGFCPIEYARSFGRRVSAYSAYLKPIERRPNLKVERYAEVTQISIDEDNYNRAEGVTYKRHGVFRGARASKELIVSAGSYGSAMLLMKSGIGPSDQLTKANIKTQVSLPVGKNFQDHIKFLLKILVDDKRITFDFKTDLNNNTVNDFIYKGQGRLTSTRSITGQAYIVSSIAVDEKEADWPDIQLALYAENLYNIFNDSGGSYENETSVYMYSYLTREKSRGSVSLNTSDINAPPIIDFNYLHDKRDLKALVEIVKVSLDLFENTNTYKRAGARYSTRPLPVCSHLPFRSDPYWECYIQNTISSGNHPVGTCRMGKGRSDPDAVVDSKLRVIGIQDLRVVDASIMPNITNANIQAAVYMIAEKSADEIKSAWGL